MCFMLNVLRLPSIGPKYACHVVFGYRFVKDTMFAQRWANIGSTHV